MDEEEHQVQDMAALLARKVFPAAKSNKTERGELLEYFSHKTGWPIGRVAGLLKGMHDLKTLYYIRSAADAYEREGEPWAKAFHGMLKPK